MNSTACWVPAEGKCCLLGSGFLQISNGKSSTRDIEWRCHLDFKTIPWSTYVTFYVASIIYIIFCVLGLFFLIRLRHGYLPSKWSWDWNLHQSSGPTSFHQPATSRCRIHPWLQPPGPFRRTRREERRGSEEAKSFLARNKSSGFGTGSVNKKMILVYVFFPVGKMKMTLWIIVTIWLIEDICRWWMFFEMWCFQPKMVKKSGKMMFGLPLIQVIHWCPVQAACYPWGSLGYFLTTTWDGLTSMWKQSILLLNASGLGSLNSTQVAHHPPGWYML